MKTILIFGASGDLTGRKLIPALFELFAAGKLTPPLAIIGVSRTPLTDAAWAERLRPLAERFAPNFTPDEWARFAAHLHYFAGDVGSDEMFGRLREELRRLEGSNDADRLYYLSLSPEFAAPVAERLARSGLAEESGGGARRLIVEKPFGIDLESSRALNRSLHASFAESQLYRIDHYLGKETVNNIFVLRFANSMFEPIWNRNYIDHVQITAHESVTIEKRGAFYDKASVLRDMFQNHLLQLLSVAAMEPPGRFDAKEVRDEKVKVLRAIRSMTPETISHAAVFGQYEGYRNEANVAPDSRTPTYAAVKLFIDNWRWKDVPIYLRSGKGMSCPSTQILIQFKEPPHLIFRPEFCGSCRSDAAWPEAAANRLLIQIQPSEGIRIGFLTKAPGSEMRVKNSELVYSFARESNRPLPDAYTRLLLDALSGDAELFARDDEIEAAWRVIDPLTAVMPDSPVYPYPLGGWGPNEAEDFLRADGRRWFNSCPALADPSGRQ